MKAALVVMGLLTSSALWAAELIELGREGNLVALDAAYPGASARMRDAMREGYKGPDLRGPDGRPIKLDAEQAKRSLRRHPTPSPYPVTTELTLSKNETVIAPVGYQGPPACVIGSDQTSQDWLRKHKATLERVSANCLLIQASSDHDLLTLRKIAKPVGVGVIHVDEPLSKLGITRYPVLVVNPALYQQHFNQ